MRVRGLDKRLFNFCRRCIIRIEKWLIFTGFLRQKTLPLPDFLCIGVEKSGTTWLYRNLKRHPELYLPERKELDYFSNDYRFYGMTLRQYSSYFKHTHKLKGESTPYENLPLKRIWFIRKIMPEVKIILILRNPVERIWSAALMHLKGRKRDFNSVTKKELLELIESSHLYDKGNYPVILKNWFSAFPREQIYIAFYDALKANPRHFLNSVFMFLNVAPQTSFKNFPVDSSFNESEKYSMPEDIKLVVKKRYAHSIEELVREFPAAKAWKID